MGVAMIQWGFPGGSVVTNLPANAGVTVLIPGFRRSLGEGNGNPLQYCCLKNPIDRGAWWATVHGVIQRVRHNLVTEERNVIQRNFLYKTGIQLVGFGCWLLTQNYSYYPAISGPVEVPWGHEIIWKYYGHALFMEMIYTFTRVL